MRVIFLGTNGWYDTNTGNTLSVLIDSKDYLVVFDAGNGIHKLEDYLDGSKKDIFLFLSHFHLDHIVGLHTLDKLKSCKKLFISGPADIKEILRQFIDAPFTMPLDKLSFENEIFELPEDNGKLPFFVEALPLKHSMLTFGYRLILENKIVTFCTDTGYCDNLVKLAKDADLLITECAFLPEENDDNWPHLNPEIAAKTALEANAKKLALVHFDAARYKTLDDRKIAQREARKYFDASFITKDDMEIII